MEIICKELNTRIDGYNFNPIFFFYKDGYLMTNILDIVNYDATKSLDNDKIMFIKQHIKRYPFINNHVQQKNNLILIVVESLMSYAIDQEINGTRVMPFLHSLKEQSYTNLKMTSQIKKGMSSDGQFIYFTGLLPLNNGVTIVQKVNNDYKGLGTIIKDNNNNLTTAMIIPTAKNFWNQSKACKAYGIDFLYNMDDYQSICNSEYSHQEWLNDEDIFKMSSKLLENNTLKAPFFLTILTGTMHLPYSFDFPDKIIDLSKAKGYSKDFLTYLEKANYTDHYISQFINFLKNHKLFNNSIIIITSDHANPVTFTESANQFCPLFIINSGRTINNQRNIGQIDVYPTILDLMNCKTKKWRGIGYSLFTPYSVKRINDKEQIKISNMIIESNGFDNYLK